jgi:hypothetical protein
LTLLIFLGEARVNVGADLDPMHSGDIHLKSISFGVILRGQSSEPMHSDGKDKAGRVSHAGQENDSSNVLAPKKQ